VQFIAQDLNFEQDLFQLRMMSLLARILGQVLQNLYKKDHLRTCEYLLRFLRYFILVRYFLRSAQEFYAVVENCVLTRLKSRKLLG
jgi:hypothetical protein